MIIQRIARAVRHQDWSALSIELLVVVVGIFLGLQVDSWNESRKEAARESIYLERLLADIEEMLAQHSAHEKIAADRLKGIYVTFDALHACALDAEAVQAFERTLMDHQFLPRLEVVRSTYDEMVASGALARIDDPVLKKKISEVYSSAVAAQQFIEYFTADLGRASDIIWRHVAFDLRPESLEEARGEDWWGPENDFLTVSYDLQALCGASTFRNAMVEVYDSVKDRLGLGERFARELASLQDLLRDRLRAT
jgi:hypothetical protein